MTDDFGAAAAAIALEAKHLEGGVVVASGHLGAVLGWPTDTPEGVDRLLDFADAHSLDVEHDGRDGFRLVRRPDPLRRELTRPDAPARRGPGTPHPIETSTP